MNKSRYMNQAVQLLESVKGHPLSDRKRQEMSIELAGLMLEEAQQTQSYREKEQEQQLGRMMNDPSGKAFTTSMTDQCFRSADSRRIADQLVFLIKKFGIPHFLNSCKKLGLFLFRELGRPLAAATVPLVKRI